MPALFDFFQKSFGKQVSFMEYFWLLTALAVFLTAVFIREAYSAKSRQKKYIKELYNMYGELPKKEYSMERYAHIDSYFCRHRREGQIDDITWNDLNMDDIFKRMNYTFSASGEEYLYYTLRTAVRTKEELEHQESMVRFFEEHPDERVKIQYLMSMLGHTGKYSLYDYIDNLDRLGQRSNRKHILADLLFLPLILLAPFRLSAAMLGIAVLVIYNIMTYFKEKGETDPYIVSFSYIIRLIETGRKLIQTEVPACREEWAQIKKCVERLGGLGRYSYFVFSGNRFGSSGNPIELLMDYLRMVFHLDLIQFNRMLRLLRDRRKEADVLIGQVGCVETAIAVGVFRASVKNGYCVPEFTEEEGESILVKNGYHPLLEEPVMNSISAEKGVLLTGSNASGKSTFLKMVAVNVILAQTIHTVMAEAYRAPIFRVYSSMSLRDDLKSGESYYMVEIRALKRILDAVCMGEEPIICFVDEVLRGTNTVERIAASTQILKSLCGQKILCFAATHDIELTELLGQDYDNYHFEEEIKDGDVKFPYQLMKGNATTQNAIRLLEMMGYDENIIERAVEMAEGFVKSGKWQISRDGSGLKAF